MTYPAGTGDSVKILPSSIEVIQSIGKICPILVSNPSINGSCGIAIQAATTAAASKITAKCLIGWSTDNLGSGLNAGFNGQTAPACRIHLPTISFTSDYIKDIATAPQYSLKYNDYYVDTDLKQTQNGGNVSRLFNTQLTRPRILYIIPFLSQNTTTTGTTLLPYPSALT